MVKLVYRLRSKVWLYPGPAGWHFVTLPRRESAEIRRNFGAAQGGWGSLAVIASIGQTSWRTSIFRDKKSEAYVLPIKAEVRKKEGIAIGQVIALTLRIQV